MSAAPLSLHTLVSGQAQQIFFFGFSADPAADADAGAAGCFSAASLDAPPNGHHPMLRVVCLLLRSPGSICGRLSLSPACLRCVCLRCPAVFSLSSCALCDRCQPFSTQSRVCSQPTQAISRQTDKQHHLQTRSTFPLCTTSSSHTSSHTAAAAATTLNAHPQRAWAREGSTSPRVRFPRTCSRPTPTSTSCERWAAGAATCWRWVYERESNCCCNDPCSSGSTSSRSSAVAAAAASAPHRHCCCCCRWSMQTAPPRCA